MLRAIYSEFMALKVTLPGSWVNLQLSTAVSLTKPVGFLQFMTTVLPLSSKLINSIVLFLFQDSLRNQNLNTGRRLQRIQKVSGAMKEQLQAFSLRRSASQQPLYKDVTEINARRMSYPSENSPTAT